MDLIFIFLFVRLESSKIVKTALFYAYSIISILILEVIDKFTSKYFKKFYCSSHPIVITSWEIHRANNYGFNLHESTNKNNKAKVNLKCKLIKIVLKGELI